jgi:hypothetical protein
VNHADGSRFELCHPDVAVALAHGEHQLSPGETKSEVALVRQRDARVVGMIHGERRTDGMLGGRIDALCPDAPMPVPVRSGVKKFAIGRPLPDLAVDDVNPFAFSDSLATSKGRNIGMPRVHAADRSGGSIEKAIVPQCTGAVDTVNSVSRNKMRQGVSDLRLKLGVPTPSTVLNRSTPSQKHSTWEVLVLYRKRGC